MVPEAQSAAPRGSARYHLLSAVAAFYLVLGALVRTVLWTRFAHHEGVSGGTLGEAMALGALNDGVTLIYLLLPLHLYLACAGRAHFTGRFGRAALGVVLYLALFVLLYVATLEYYFFDEFDARFNLVAVDYLIYPTEVIGNIRDSYPVGKASALIALAAALLWWPVRRRLRATEADATPARTRWARLGAHAAGAFLMGFMLSADSFAPFENRVANELAENGAATFFAALHTNELQYPDFYRTLPPERALSLLNANLAGGGFAKGADGTMTRHFVAHGKGLGPLNIVVFSEESFGAEFVGAYGDPRGLTPEFDALAKQGLLFTHAYATGTRTVRGLEAISASLPPVPSESVIKRPGNQQVITWGEVLQKLGYHTSFLYGGYGAFDNMNAYFAGNGFALSDRSEIEKPKFANVWGVSDEDLFEHALKYFDARAAENKPFFSIIMSTSNHKPYTFPEGVPGVKAKGGGREAGVRYADYALGQFFRAAPDHAWYKNTVFVIVADHGARVYGAQQIPLFSYEIPLLVLAPGHLATNREETLTSQIDIAPTVMGLLGFSYDAPFFGEDVLAWPADRPRALLFNHNHDVALLRDSKIAILGLKREAITQRYEHRDSSVRRKRDHYETIEPDDDLLDLAAAYYQSAYDWFERPPAN